MFLDIHFARDLARYLAVVTIISLLIVAEWGIAVQILSLPPSENAAVFLNR